MPIIIKHTHLLRPIIIHNITLKTEQFGIFVWWLLIHCLLVSACSNYLNEKWNNTFRIGDGMSDMRFNGSHNYETQRQPTDRLIWNGTICWCGLSFAAAFFSVSKHEHNFIFALMQIYIFFFYNWNFAAFRLLHNTIELEIHWHSMLWKMKIRKKRKTPKVRELLSCFLYFCFVANFVDGFLLFKQGFSTIIVSYKKNEQKAPEIFCFSVFTGISCWFSFSSALILYSANLALAAFPC